MPSPSPQQQPPPATTVGMWEAAAFVWQVLALVAIPTTLFALGGRWVDTHYGTTPWATLAGLAIAITAALAATLHLARRMAKKL